MADLLFPAFEQRIHCQKKLFYAAFLTDIVRSASDAIEALELFRGLLLGTNHGPQSVGFMAFDAHGGDTACHLRTGMLLEVFSVHRQLISNQTTGTPMIPLWINKNIQSLEETREQAKKICAALTKDRIHPLKLGLGAKEDTTQHMFSVLSWEEPAFPRNRESLYCSAEPCPETPKEGPPVSFPETGSSSPVCVDSPDSELCGFLRNQLSSVLNVGETPLDFAQRKQSGKSDIQHQSLFHPSYDWNAALLSFGSPQSPSSGTTASTVCSETELLPLQTQWDLLDSKSLVRFVVYSYILSKYKTFYCFKDIVGARLYPEGAVSHGYELMEQFWDFKNVQYKKAKLERMALELRALQTWLSDFSCAWLRSLATRFSPRSSMARLLLGTVQRSNKGLTVAACYPGYLLLRNELSREEQTFVMIDRHFCPHGIHFNVFLADLAPSDNTEDHEASPTRIFDPVNWKVRYTALPDLCTLPDQSRPHPVVMGNSIQGSSADYISRLSSHYTPNPVGTSVHEDATCEENTAHTKDFLATDHDRLALSFFAAHKSYSFPLADTKDETEFVGSKMDEEYPGLREQWIASREEIAKLGGGGESLKTFGWQHMFVDTKERLAHKLEIWMKNQDLMPLSADVTVKSANTSP